MSYEIDIGAERCGGTPGNPKRLGGATNNEFHQGWHTLIVLPPLRLGFADGTGSGCDASCKPCPGCPDCNPDTIPHLLEVNRNLRNRIAELEAEKAKLYEALHEVFYLTKDGAENISGLRLEKTWRERTAAFLQEKP